MDVSEAIKLIRSEKGISQAEIARRLDLERGNYSRLENRGSKMSLDQLESIAKALDVTLVELLTWGESAEVETVSLSGEVVELRNRVRDLEEKNRMGAEINSLFRSSLGLLVTAYGEAIQIIRSDKPGSIDLRIFDQILKNLAVVKENYKFD